jgi:hypothetical protein
MTMSQLSGLLGLLAVAAFVVLAFRQGMAVRPDSRQDQGTSIRPRRLRSAALIPLIRRLFADPRMLPEKACPALDAGWKPVFRTRHAQTQGIPPALL